VLEKEKDLDKLVEEEPQLEVQVVDQQLLIQVKVALLLLMAKVKELDKPLMEKMDHQLQLEVLVVELPQQKEKVQLLKEVDPEKVQLLQMVDQFQSVDQVVEVLQFQELDQPQVKDQAAAQPQQEHHHQVNSPYHHPHQPQAEVVP